MGEDLLVLVMKMARVEPARNKFSIDDCAILKCISKSVQEQSNDILSNKDSLGTVWRNTLVHLGYNNNEAILQQIGLNTLTQCPSITQKKNAKDPVENSKEDRILFHPEVVIRTFIRTKRLLLAMEKSNSIKPQHKLVALLNELTSKVATNAFLPRHLWTLSSQWMTMRALLNLCEGPCKEMKMLGCFFAYHFLSNCLKIRHRPDSLLSQARFRHVVIAKADEIKYDLRNGISMLPYGFTEKIMRCLSHTSSALRKW